MIRAGDSINWQSPINRAHQLNCDLHGWWMVTPDTRGGYSLRDLTNETLSTIRDNTTAANGMWRFDSRRGGWGSLALDGTNDNVLVDTTKGTTMMAGFGQFTIMAWVKTSNTDTQCVFGCFDGADDCFHFEINRGASLDTAGAVFAIGRTGVTSDLTGYTADTGLADGLWHHVAVAWHHGTQLMQFYVDGRNWATTYTEQAIGNTFATFDRTVLIGAMNSEGSVARPISGNLDDVRFYRRALAAPEVDRYYRLSLQGYPGILNRFTSPAVSATAVGSIPRVMRHRMSQGMS